MIMIDEQIDHLAVTILCDDPNKETYVKIEMVLPALRVTVLDKTFPNAIMASANLQSYLMTSRAVDLLTKHGIPRTHPIWDLNHSPFWQRG